MKRYLLLLLALLSLACSTQTSLPLIFPVTLTQTAPVSTPMPSINKWIVTAEVLHIRNAPDGDVTGYLYQGDSVEVFGDSKIIEGYSWCKIQIEPPQWVACEWIRQEK